jgi:hypothetical protein
MGLSAVSAALDSSTIQFSLSLVALLFEFVPSKTPFPLVAIPFVPTQIKPTSSNSPPTSFSEYEKIIKLSETHCFQYSFRH